jgi:ABC-type multidrug transport system permease subunit
MCLLHTFTSFFVIYDIATENKELAINHSQYYERNMSTEFNICLIVMCVFNVLALMFLVNLIKFHIELK